MRATIVLAALVGFGCGTDPEVVGSFQPECPCDPEGGSSIQPGRDAPADPATEPPAEEEPPGPDSEPECNEELRMQTAIDALESSNVATDFVALLRTNDGRELVVEHGKATVRDSFRSASTAKWVTAAVILRLVDQGLMSLDDHPQDYLDFWTQDPAAPLSHITLEHLLSFTSGLERTPLCMYRQLISYEECVEDIHDMNLASAIAPGTRFYYASTHLQVAALMATRALGRHHWNGVFVQFQRATGLLGDAVYDIPSAINPMVAGGMHWSPSEYIEFLEQFPDELFSQGARDYIMQDHIVDAEVGYSAAMDLLNQDWRYGFGFWVECGSEVYDCDSLGRISSPGARGSYPFIDLELGLKGIIAYDGDVTDGAVGFEIYEAAAAEIESWVEGC